MSTHGEIISFYVEDDGDHVVMTCDNPDEGACITVRASKAELAAMSDAEPVYLMVRPQQTATPGR